MCCARFCPATRACRGRHLFRRVEPAVRLHARLVRRAIWGLRALVPQAERGVLLPSSRCGIRAMRCSDMERLRLPFDYALQRVALSLAFCARLRELQGNRAVQIRDRFASARAPSPGWRSAGLELPAERLDAIAGGSARRPSATMPPGWIRFPA